jgi:hypothetical protein
MAIFGLACEGVTDQITIENILCGYFPPYPDLDSEIEYFQPQFDETDQKQKQSEGAGGGWTRLFSYLRSTRFRDDALNTQFIVVQIDTDISGEKGFDVPTFDPNNQEIDTFIIAVIERLIEFIEEGETDFYKNHSDKIIFCICVHSIECWLYAYYNKKSLKKPKITGCHKALSFSLLGENKSLEKDYSTYNKYSSALSTPKNLDIAIKKDPSLQFFIRRLEKITLTEITAPPPPT